jgi:hypothetical protein
MFVTDYWLPPASMKEGSFALQFIQVASYLQSGRQADNRQSSLRLRLCLLGDPKIQKKKGEEEE